MAKGYDFEKEVSRLLKSDYKIKINYFAKSKGKQKEIDIVATRKLPGLGKIHFLIECKAYRVGENIVKDYNTKIAEIREASDPYSEGKPVIISSVGFTKPAKDIAIKFGIILKQIQGVQEQIPIPKSLELHLAKLQTAYRHLMELETPIILFDDFEFIITKSKRNHKIRGVGELDYYMEGKGKKKRMILGFGKYIGRLNQPVAKDLIQSIEKHVSSEQEKGKKIEYVTIGLFTKALTENERGFFNKIKNYTKFEVAVIDENIKKFGNLNAKWVFDVLK